MVFTIKDGVFRLKIFPKPIHWIPQCKTYREKSLRQVTSQEVRILFQNDTQPHPENPGLSGTVSHFTTVSPQWNYLKKNIYIDLPIPFKRKKHVHSYFPLRFLHSHIFPFDFSLDFPIFSPYLSRVCLKYLYLSEKVVVPL
jgi:hypothetical protein